MCNLAWRAQSLHSFFCAPCREHISQPLSDDRVLQLTINNASLCGIRGPVGPTGPPLVMGLPTWRQFPSILFPPLRPPFPRDPASPSIGRIRTLILLSPDLVLNARHLEQSSPGDPVQASAQIRRSRAQATLNNNRVAKIARIRHPALSFAAIRSILGMRASLSASFAVG